MTTQHRYEFCIEMVDGLLAGMPQPNNPADRTRVVLALLNSEYAYMFANLEHDQVIHILGISERDYKNTTKQAIRKLRGFSTHKHTKDIRELAIEIEELLYTDMTDDNKRD